MTTNAQSLDSRDADFTVRRVGIVEAPLEATCVVGLAEEADGGGRNLLFQIASAYDAQDARRHQRAWARGVRANGR
jgi:hypothetical protein